MKASDQHRKVKSAGMIFVCEQGFCPCGGKDGLDSEFLNHREEDDKQREVVYETSLGRFD